MDEAIGNTPAKVSGHVIMERHQKEGVVAPVSPVGTLYDGVDSQFIRRYVGDGDSGVYRSGPCSFDVNMEDFTYVVVGAHWGQGTSVFFVRQARCVHPFIHTSHCSAFGNLRELEFFVFVL